MTPKFEIDLSRARSAAQNLCRKFFINDPAKIILENLAMARKVFVKEGPLDGAEARLLRRGKRGIIRVKASIPEVGRKRFALAHELGHWELHGDISQWNLCTTEEIVAYRGSKEELEANAFAAELLMPTALMRPRCRNEEPRLALIQALAQEFRTTLSATAVRFVEECKEVCAVVFSADRQVQWWRAQDRTGIWIEHGQAIDERSDAWNPTLGIDMHRVPADAWFPARTPRRCKVYEQSMVLGSYGTVLTLLYVIDDDDDEDDEDQD